MIQQELHSDILLECGETLHNARIVFHSSKQKWNGRDRVIWICHALTANSNPEDWWPGMAGEGLAIDTSRDFVVCVNMLGSPYGSEGPATVNPATGKPRLIDFPPITVRDIVGTLTLVRKHLKINTIDLLIGSSIGGFQAIEWAVTEPTVFRRCLFIATAPRISPYVTATLEAQRMALEADHSFREAKDIHGGEAGLKCARAQALISYRSFEGYALTQADEDPDTVQAQRAASYERYQGEKLVRRNFDAYSYYSLCNTMDSQNVGRGRGGVEEALKRIRAITTVVAIDSDSLFPPLEGRVWSKYIGGARYIEIPSRFGHDGFLLENSRLGAIIMEK